MKGYYLLEERFTQYGLFQLWESNAYGDEIPAKLTLNGVEVMDTWDDIYTASDDYIDNID